MIQGEVGQDITPFVLAEQTAVMEAGEKSYLCSGAGGTTNLLSVKGWDMMKSKQVIDIVLAPLQQAEAISS